MKNLGMSIELDPKGYENTCLAYGLHSSQQNTLLWDILFWTWRVLHIRQNRVRDPLTRRDIVTFALTDKNSVYPVHSPEIEEDDDEKPLVRSDRAADSEDEDDKPLVQPSSRKEPVKEKRESAAERRTPADYS